MPFLLLSACCCIAQIPGIHDTSKHLQPLYGSIAPSYNKDYIGKVTIPNAVIESVTLDPKGFYAVTVVVNHPPANDQVKVWVELPVKNWNGRFCGVGGGGFMGGSQYQFSELIDRGFAVAANDGGHSGMSGAFALDTIHHRLNWQEIRDYAYLGVHDMALVAKALIQAFYGLPARYAYFIGGSNGGRQGITAGQRYPADFDGILAYYPAIHFTRALLADLWPQAVMNDAKHFVTVDKLKAVTKAVIAACDGDDGFKDGVIDDPAACKWDPALFTGTKVGNDIFTDEDANVVRRIWGGATTQDGKFLWHGMPRGSDLTALAGAKVNSTFYDWARYFLLTDPHWDVSSLTCAKFEILWNQAVEQYNDVLYAENPDMAPFRAHGGKLLVLHGMADQLIPYQGSIDYLQQVQRKMGGAKTTAKFMRLYLIPGMDHFVLGPKPLGAFDALMHWVEQGKAPSKIPVEQRDRSGNISRSRLLYPYN